MKNYKLVYRSIEDSNANVSFDTVITEHYNTLDDALKNSYDLENYEAHESSVEKSVALVIEDETTVNEYLLASQEWDYKEESWKNVINYHFDINSPNDEYDK